MTRMGSSQYTIGSPTRTCAATGKLLGVGERYVAALVQMPLEGEGGEAKQTDELVRVDFSDEAWRGGARPGNGAALLGFWRGVVPVDGAKKLLIDDEALLDLFEQSGELEASADGEEKSGRDRAVFRFVLALLLLRKRLLIQEGSKDDGRVMVVRVKGTPSVKAGGDASAWIEVEDPGLDDEAVARVTLQLHAVLSDEASGAGVEGKNS